MPHIAKGSTKHKRHLRGRRVTAKRSFPSLPRTFPLKKDYCHSPRTPTPMQVPLTAYTDAEKTHPADDPYCPSPFRGLLFSPRAFPLKEDYCRSPRTPTPMQVPLTAYTDAEKTHPADDPYYPSPFRGLLFSKGEGGGTLFREGALYTECNDSERVTGVGSNIAGNYQGELPFTSASHTVGLMVHPAKDVIYPGIGVFRGSLFRSILTGPNDGVEGAFHLLT